MDTNMIHGCILYLLVSVILPKCKTIDNSKIWHGFINVKWHNWVRNTFLGEKMLQSFKMGCQMSWVLCIPVYVRRRRCRITQQSVKVWDATARQACVSALQAVWQGFQINGSQTSPSISSVFPRNWTKSFVCVADVGNEKDIFVASPFNSSVIT